MSLNRRARRARLHEEHIFGHTPRGENLLAIELAQLDVPAASHIDRLQLLHVDRARHEVRAPGAPEPLRLIAPILG